MEIAKQIDAITKASIEALTINGSYFGVPASAIQSVHAALLSAEASVGRVERRDRIVLPPGVLRAKPAPAGPHAVVLHGGPWDGREVPVPYLEDEFVGPGDVGRYCASERLDAWMRRIFVHRGGQ